MALTASLSALTDLDRLELARIDDMGFSLRLKTLSRTQSPGTKSQSW